MKQKKIFMFLVINLILVGMIFISGCEETPKNNGNNLPAVYIKNNNDDGYIAIEESKITGIIKSESNQAMKVGLFSSSEFSPTEVNYTSRGILRFDISDWDNQNITFFIKCTKVIGSPGEMEVYFMDNPEDDLPDYSELKDVNNIWTLTDTAKFVSSTTPSENEWVEILIPADFLNLIINEKYSNDKYITFMLQLFFDLELGEQGNYYEFATVDYTPDNDEDQPYIQFN